MEKEYILFIDSGIGGISTLKETIICLKTNYIYYADTIHCPYGSHSQTEICEYLKNIISKMISRYKIKIVVLACNTATTSAINYLRKTFFDIFFIGTEPAIKVAFDKNYKKILSIATPTTIIQDKYLKLIKNTDTYIKSIALDEFAKTIEDYLIKTSLKNKYHLLKEIFKIKKLSINFDAIVLGCTHYVIIKDLLKKYINIPLIDGNFGIAKMVCNQFSKTKISQERLNIKFFLSNNNNFQKQKYIKILNQILAKI